MKIKHDPKHGHFILLMNEKNNAGSKMVAPNCILDFDSDGNVIAVEILDAPKHDIDPTVVEYIDVTDPLYRDAQNKRMQERRAAHEAQKNKPS